MHELTEFSVGFKRLFLGGRLAFCDVLVGMSSRLTMIGALLSDALAGAL